MAAFSCLMFQVMPVRRSGIKFNDLFLPGIILMLAGYLLVSVTGRFILNLAGIP